MQKKTEVAEPGLRMAIDAAKLYYTVKRTSDILSGAPPKRVGLSLGRAIYLSLQGLSP